MILCSAQPRAAFQVREIVDRLNGKRTLRYRMEFSEIEDSRAAGAFSGRTFSGCSKSESEKDLSAALGRGDIETSVYRSADLLCAGHLVAVWEVFADFFCKHIGTRNPGIVVFLARKQERVADIIASQRDLLELRNSVPVRRALAETCVVLCLSPKRPASSYSTIHAASEFRLDVLSQRVAATSETFIYSVFNKDDSPEIHIPVNELGFSINTSPRDFAAAAYWIEWIIEYDHLCRQNKDRCNCSERLDMMRLLPSTVSVSSAGKQNVVWVIWQLFLIECNNRSASAFFRTVTLAAMQLFAFKFVATSPRRRRGLILFAAAMLCADAPPSRCEVLASANRPVMQSVLDELDSTYASLCKEQTNVPIEMQHYVCVP